MVVVQAGNLRRRLTWQRPAAGSEIVRDEAGQIVENFVAVKTVWGSVEPLDGDELTQARQQQSTATHLVKIRRDPDLLPNETWRFTVGGRRFNVESVLNEGDRDVDLKIKAIEQTTGSV